MEVQQFTLPNGIRVVHHTVPSLVSHAGVFLNTGSRDELPDENGLAHFIEHVIFKGTENRKAYQILSRMENVGGDLNAYTSKEETCVYASFLPEHYGRALELFSDILFHSTFPEKELSKEKEVILEEINGYLDTPFEQIFDDFEDLLFDGHPLGRNILGTPEQLKTFGRKEVHNFIRRNYRSTETLVCSVGPESFKNVKRLTQKYFGEQLWAAGERSRIAVNGYTPQNSILTRSGYQTHCILGTRAYSIYDEKQVAMSVLNNILGGPGMNSRLNLGIREKYGLTYHIESGYQPYSDTGVFEVYLGTDASTYERVVELTKKEFEKLRKNALGSLQLQRARQQIKGQIAIAGESNLNLMLAIGKSVLMKDKVESLEDVYRKIDTVTQLDLLEVANEIFDPAILSSLVFKTPLG